MNAAVDPALFVCKDLGDTREKKKKQKPKATMVFVRR